MTDPSTTSYLRSILDAIPSLIFIVNKDTRISDANRAAKRFLGEGAQAHLRRLCGQVLHCIHAREEPGCGRTPFCPDCVVRQCIVAAFAGKHSVRQMAKLQVEEKGRVDEVQYMVTTAAFQFAGEEHVLLVLEDVTELAELRRIIPICCSCHRARDDAQFWQDVETYLRNHTGIEFSHGLCPECVKKLYPDYAPKPSE
ncbi:MAG: PAS domain-containing protein [Candidatus Sumerlaeia bacterium]|nr:PAS domain-containing protein [Candidatus Sumerlaeia bacterium]